MFELIKSALKRSGDRIPPGVHFHRDDDGREYACHDWECNPRNRPLHLRDWHNR